MMKNKVISWTLRTIAILALAVGTGAQAQAPSPRHFSGVFNDYTPATGVSGPWEMHGTWSLKLEGDSGKADFSAFMTMEHSDYWILAHPITLPNSPNVDNPGTRSPHTHHITMKDAVVSYDTSVCPTNNPATTVPGFVVTGPVSITGNGSPAPFEAKGPSTLQVCINGGTEIQFSNVTLVLTGPAATGHFGGQPIHGVVRIVRSSDKGDPDKK
jgi:hypothetical protein